MIPMMIAITPDVVFAHTPRIKVIHPYTPDAARAVALLGNTPDAFNQVWHLPTDKNPPRPVGRWRISL